MFPIKVKVFLSKKKVILFKYKYDLIASVCGCGKHSDSGMRMPTPPIKNESRGHVSYKAKGVIDGPSGHS